MGKSECTAVVIVTLDVVLGRHGVMAPVAYRFSIPKGASVFFLSGHGWPNLSPQISKVSVQTASNTPWMQGKAFLLRILKYSCPVKSIVNYPIQTLIFSP